MIKIKFVVLSIISAIFLASTPLYCATPQVFCWYSDVAGQSDGISNLMTGVPPSGNPIVDGINLLAGFVDDMKEFVHRNIFVCSFDAKTQDDKEFKEMISRGDIKYFVCYDGLFSKYQKHYFTPLVDTNTFKSDIDYIGVADKNNNVLCLFKVSEGKLLQPTEDDWKNLSKYTYEAD